MPCSISLFTPTVYFPGATAIPHPSVNSRARCTRFIRATVISSGFTKVYRSPGEIPAGRFFRFSGALRVSRQALQGGGDGIGHYYPGLYMEAAGQNAMRGKWAAYPKEVMDGDPSNPLTVGIPTIW